MSTQHVIFALPSGYLEADERSSEFTLEYFNNDLEEGVVLFTNMTPEQLAKAGAEMLRVANYHLVGEFDLDALVNHLKKVGLVQ